MDYAEEMFDFILEEGAVSNPLRPQYDHIYFML
jgi:hypothetical protein